MDKPLSDTIFAMATAPGRAGVAVLRLSGPKTESLVRLLAGDLPPARRASLRHLKWKGEILDRGLVLWFPGPASFTGEDLAEFHLHGGRAVSRAVIAALTEHSGVRPAEPGEFSRRAFDHGKLDLTEAEGLADLVDSETEAQRRQALRQMEGGLKEIILGWRESLIRAMSLAEAEIDFPDEGLPPDLDQEARVIVADLAQEMAASLTTSVVAERLREGVSIAILGPPNAGKSSLLNKLAGRDAAIVSTRAGTTRDVVEVHLDIEGFPVTLSDTAGLREAGEEIEAEGIRRSLARAEVSDIKIIVFDANDWPRVDSQVAALVDDQAILLVNKLDQKRPAPPLLYMGRSVLGISVQSGEGIEEFLRELGSAVERCCQVTPLAGLTRARHRASVGEALGYLRRSQLAGAPELRAEDLRLAARALGKIIGQVDVEEVLDQIFSSFCIGK